MCWNLTIVFLNGVWWYLTMVLICIFLIADLEHPFIHVCWSLHFFPWEMNVYTLCPFLSCSVFLLSRFFNCSHILNVNPLSDVLGHFFTLVILFYFFQKLLGWYSSSYLFAFASSAFHFVKFCIFPMFPSSGIIVSNLTFRFLIHFGFILWRMRSAWWRSSSLHRDSLDFKSEDWTLFSFLALNAGISIPWIRFFKL